MGLFSKIRNYFKKDDNPAVAVAIVRSSVESSAVKSVEKPISLPLLYNQFKRKEREIERAKQISGFLNDEVLYGKGLDNALFGLANDYEVLQERLKIFIEQNINNNTIVTGNKITQLTKEDFHYLSDKFKEKIETLEEAAQVSSGINSERYLSMAKSFTRAVYAIYRKYGVGREELGRMGAPAYHKKDLESMADTPWKDLVAASWF